MYGFAFIRAQCGPWEEETEMTVVRVGSNLKESFSLALHYCEFINKPTFMSHAFKSEAC